jgi:hypothetical protein
VAPQPRRRVSKPEIRSLHWAATASHQPKTSQPSLLITIRVTASRSAGLTRQAACRHSHPGWESGGLGRRQASRYSWDFGSAQL